ncbi:hypothetical protein ACET3Z_018287 [Daucus carota]
MARDLLAIPFSVAGSYDAFVYQDYPMADKSLDSDNTSPTKPSLQVEQEEQLQEEGAENEEDEENPEFNADDLVDSDVDTSLAMDYFCTAGITFEVLNTYQGVVVLAFSCFPMIFGLKKIISVIFKNGLSVTDMGSDRDHEPVKIVEIMEDNEVMQW